MNSASLENIGKVLYGRQWQTNLAVDLEVSSRTVRNWSSGAVLIPQAKAQAIVTLVHDRAAMLALLAQKLKA